eukprot:3377107-Rhodomonas_salina.3
MQPIDLILIEPIGVPRVPVAHVHTHTTNQVSWEQTTHQFPLWYLGVYCVCPSLFLFGTKRPKLSSGR